MASLPQAKLLLCLILYSISSRVTAQNLLDPIPRPCRSLAGGPSPPSDVEVKRNEYPAGGTMMVLAQVPGGIKGIFEFYLCLEDGNSQDEECLVRQPLQLADGSGTKFDMSTIPEPGNFEIPVVIPDNVSCEKCTLQWRVLVEECPSDMNCQVMDEEFCADISVREIKVRDKRIFGILFSVLSAFK
ncbi:uncharacterized protein [Macrobrachium rosenbergii]|uniref:uncharacterized protein isoform X2 n=1 Tax=Macrobrachium rosenbergii TaxID=79674 RepID=UPI0034D42C29